MTKVRMAVTAERVGRLKRKTLRTSAWQAKEIDGIRTPCLCVGTIYFLQAGGLGGPIKIGWTQDLETRLRELRTASAFPLRVLVTVGGTRASEHDFHMDVRRSWLRGEWFAPSDDVMEMVAGVQRFNEPTTPAFQEG